MQKNYLLSALAVFGLAISSCSNEDVLPVGNDGEISFTAELPTNVNTRAYSDGKFVGTLKYAVYDADGLVMTDESSGAPVAVYSSADNKFTLSLKLEKGKKYDFAFWAQASDAPYELNATDAGVTVDMNYDVDATPNNEKRDAFFNVEKGVSVDAGVQKRIELRRPFAQLNVGTKDMVDFKSELGDISVTVSGVYNSLDLFSGIAADPKDITFIGVKPETDTQFPVESKNEGEKYEYLSMNYILTGSDIPDASNVNVAQKETMDVKILINKVKDGGQSKVAEIPLSAVPFQRNFRTNIYGSLLTSSFDYNIEIKPGINDDPSGNFDIAWNGEVAEVPAPDAEGVINITSPAELAGVAKAVREGKQFKGQTIKLAKDINLSNIAWTPIGPEYGSVNGENGAFLGTFDGDGHTISNLYCKAEGERATAGLFGVVNGVVKNVNLKNVNLISDHYAGAVVAYLYHSAGNTGNVVASVLNCTVDGGSIVSVAKNGDNGDKAGGIVGGVWQHDVEISGNYAKNLTVEGYRHVGGIIGIIEQAKNKTLYTFSNNKVEHVTVVQNLTDNYKTLLPGQLVGAIAGYTNNYTVNSTNTASDIDFVFKNYKATAPLNINNSLKARTMTFDNVDVQSISLNGNFKVVIENSIITPAAENPGDTNRFGLFWAVGGSSYDLTIRNTKFNGSWGHAIYIQGNSDTMNSKSNRIDITGCSFAEWGKKEAADEDIMTSAAFKTIRTGNFADESVCASFADSFINNNSFDSATMATGRIHVALGGGNVDTYRK